MTSYMIISMLDTLQPDLNSELIPTSRYLKDSRISFICDQLVLNAVRIQIQINLRQNAWLFYYAVTPFRG